MINSLRRIKVLLLMLFVIIAITLSGCTIGNIRFIFGEDTTKNLVLDMGGYGDCDRNKALVYLLIAKAEYEEIFGEDVWTLKIDDMPMEEFVKNNTLGELVQRESMSALAMYEGIELSEEQLEVVDNATEEFFKSVSEEQLLVLGITKQDIEEVFKSHMLSELVYDVIAKTVNTQISDSEAKVITVQYLKVKAEDKKIVEAMHEMLEQTQDLYSVAEEYTEVEVVETDICRGELADTLGSEVEETVFALTKGEISRVLTIREYCYIFKSISDYDSAKTEKNKSVMLKERKQEAFLSKYNEFMETSEYKINDKLWEAMSIADVEEITLGGFYDICDKYGI